MQHMLATSILADIWKRKWLFNTLQHTATHCNTLQHTATHCNTLKTYGSVSDSLTHCNTLQHTATHCNALQHTATHCNTLQHPVIVLQNAKTDPTDDGDKQTGRHGGSGGVNSGRLGGMGGEGGGDMQNDVDCTYTGVVWKHHDVDWSYCYSSDARIAFDRWQMLNSHKVCSLLHRLWTMTIALTFEKFFASFAVIPCSGCPTLRMRAMVVEFLKSRLCSYIIEHI